MKRLVLPGLVLAATVLAVPLVAAAAVPESDACVKARAELELAVAAVVDFNPNVYPDDKTPTPAQVTPALLTVILGDPDLGGGARAEVEAALALFAAVDVACAEPTPTLTPSPTPTPTTPAPTPAPSPAPTTTAPRPDPEPADDGGQVRRVPRGGVDTGGWPTAPGAS